MRYVGAISDTDILINLAKVKRLDILEHLFEEIIIPQYIYDELRRKAGRCFSGIVQAFNKDEGVFKILDRKKDKSLNMLSKGIIGEKKKVIGPGESECAGYAHAMRIPIIISDNQTEFKWLDEFITLTHRNILALSVHFGHITEELGEEIFDDINKQLDRPTRNTFKECCQKSMNTFLENGWDEYLRLNQH